MTSPPQDGILEQAEQVSSLIATARRLIAEGKTVDLSNLEDKIRTLCAQAEEMAQGDPAPIRNALSAISEDLDRLEEETAARHRELGGGGMADALRHAIGAYSPDGEED